MWGRLVNASRSLSRQAEALSDGAPMLEMVRLNIAFAHALRCHLRREEPWTEIEPFVDAATIEELRTEPNVPNALVHMMGVEARHVYRSGLFDSIRLVQIDNMLVEFASVQGGREWIKNTPLPRQ